MPLPHSSALARLLPTVVRPARYAGNEWNSIVKDWAHRLRVALVYPDVYEEGVGNPWLQSLYTELNSQDDILCERAFVPWPDMDEAMRGAGVPLYALESKRPLAESDLVLIALPDELCAPAVLTALDLAGIGWPPAGKPLVVGIGPGSANPEPLAGFFNAFIMGDVDSDTLRQMFEVLRSPGAAHPEWLYVSDGHESEIITPRRAATLPPLPGRPVVPFAETKRERVAIDLSCPPFYPWSEQPGRERPVNEILAAAPAMLAATGYDHVHLSGPHSDLPEIVDRLSARYSGAHLHITLETPFVTAETVDLADRLPHITRGPLVIDMAHTAGSELLETVRLAFRRGWHIIRLLVCIGGPNETLSDLDTLVLTARQVRDIGREEIDGQAQVQVIATPFVPRHFGPHAQARLLVGDEWQQRLDVLTRGIRGPGLRLQWRAVETRLIAAALARGDRRMGAVIETAWRAGMRRPDEAQNAAAWQAAGEATGVDLFAQAAGE